jgi:UDP-2,4-diacetamido-2,4,6-trideoxy-beta-L-altropyranose hydrolase
MNVLFRVNAGPEKGLGHLTRCIALAEALEKYGTACHFLMNEHNENIQAFLKDRSVSVLPSCSSRDHLSDALETTKTAHEKECHLVIMDDYELNKDWETYIRQQGLKLMVIDDILRPHDCHYLLDYRWRGNHGTKAYDHLTSSDCTKLLGPAYVLLNENYKTQHKNINGARHAHMNITLGFGGAGSFDFAAPIIHTLLENIHDTIKLHVILGPLFTGTGQLRKSCAAYKNIEFIVGQTDLFDILSKTDLYIGPAGTVMYQLCALGVPALTFSTAQNQDNVHRYLEDIGHYFHINRFSPDQAEQLALCVSTFMAHYDRVKKFTQSPPYPIDGLGAKRVAQTILKRKAAPYIRLQNKEKTPSIPIKSECHTIREVTDCDINHYLNARNLSVNRQNMTFCDEINRLAHYHWWFNTKRQSYLLSYNGEARLYIWHTSFTKDQQDFLIGGWFVCSQSVQFQDSLIALAWQLEYCAQFHPDAIWLAVINRDNKSVKKLNDYMGFIEMDESHPYFPITQNAFPEASYDKFHYVFLSSALKARTL